MTLVRISDAAFCALQLEVSCLQLHTVVFWKLFAYDWSFFAYSKNWRSAQGVKNVWGKETPFSMAPQDRVMSGVSVDAQSL